MKTLSRIRNTMLVTAALGSLVAAPTIAQESSRIRVVDDAENNQLIVELGPIDLPAGITHNGLEQMPVQQDVFPFDLFMYGYEVEAVDGAGQQIPHSVIHHANILDPAHRELFLPIMRRVIASGSETKSQTLPRGMAGIPFTAGDRLLALTMLHNPTDVSYEDVVVRFKLLYTTDAPASQIYPLHLDVMFPTGSKAFDIPAGRSVKAWEGSPIVEGRIVGLGGHVHRYATRLWLRDLTTGENIYDVQPVAQADGVVEEVPVQVYMDADGIGVPIFPDHRYRVSVQYDNPTGQLISQDAMGSVAGAFVTSADPAVLVADPSDNLFMRDYQWVLESVSAGHGAHGGHEGNRYW